MSNAAYKNDYDAEQGRLNSGRMLEKWKRKHGDDGVAAIVRREAALFLSDPTYSGPLADMFDRRDCLLEAECWIDRSKVYARDEWLAHDKDGIITRMEGAHQEAKVHMADLHAFLTAEAVAFMHGKNFEQTLILALIDHVAIESIAQAIEGDDERLMMLMEAGL